MRIRQRSVKVSRVVAHLVLIGCVFASAVSVCTANQSSHVHYARGLVPFHTGLWVDALRQFDAAVAADPEDALARYYRGLTNARRGAGAAAVADIEKALSLQPGLEGAALNLGIAYFDSGNFVKAKKWLEKAYEEGRERQTAAFFLGLASYRNRQYAKALSLFQEAEADPEIRYSARYYSGMTLLRSGRKRAAKAKFRDLVEEQPELEVSQLASDFLAGGMDDVTVVSEDPQQMHPWSLVASTSLGFDSNVNIGPSDGVAGTTDESDGFLAFSAAGRYTLLRSDVVDVSATADFYQGVHFSGSDFDLSSIRPGIQASGRSEWFLYGAAFRYEYNALDYSSFYQEFMVLPWMGIAETDWTATQVYYRYRFRDFLDQPFDPFRDGAGNAFGVRQAFVAGQGQYLFSLGYEFEDVEPEDAGPIPVGASAVDIARTRGANDFQFTVNQIDLDMTASLSSILSSWFDWHGGLAKSATFDAGYRFRLEDYNNTNSRALRTREDKEHQFAVGVGAKVSDNLRLQSNLVTVVNQSNIPQFDFDRVLAWVGLELSL